MANFYRLVFLFLFLAVGPCAVQAFPATPATYTYTLYGGGPFSTQAASCADYAARYTEPPWTVIVNSSAPNCVVNVKKDGFDNRVDTVPYTIVSKPASCPAPAVLSGGACYCPQGVGDDGTKCNSACGKLGDAVLGSSSANQYGGTGSYSGGTLCVSSCLVYPGSSFKAPSGKWYANGPLTNVGIACSMTPVNGGGGDVPPAAETPPVACKIGTCPGTVNGTNVCMPCSSGATTSNSGITTTVAGTSSGSTGTGSGGPGSGVPGTSTTSIDSRTECSGNNCRTVTTTNGTGPDGVTTTSVQTQDIPKDDYCVKNPRSPLCITSSFSGSCEGSFQCEGDAVQCALAKELHSQNCRMNKQNSQSALFDVESVRTGNQTLNLPGNATVNISSASFDSSNALNAGPSCIASKSITVMGRSVVLPFNTVCPYLEQLGSLLLAVSFLLAVRILFRG